MLDGGYIRRIPARGALCRYDHDVPMNVYSPEPLSSLNVSMYSFRYSEMSGRMFRPSSRFIESHVRVDILFVPHRRSIRVWRCSSCRSVSILFATESYATFSHPCHRSPDLTRSPDSRCVSSVSRFHAENGTRDTFSLSLWVLVREKSRILLC